MNECQRKILRYGFYQMIRARNYDNYLFLACKKKTETFFTMFNTNRFGYLFLFTLQRRQTCERTSNTKSHTYLFVRSLENEYNRERKHMVFGLMLIFIYHFDVLQSSLDSTMTYEREKAEIVKSN